MTTKEHPYANLLRAVADGKTINDHLGCKVPAHHALHLISKSHAAHLTIAPDTITVNGIEVPAPYLGEMKIGQQYWTADPGSEGYVSYCTWCDDRWDRMWMARGLVHLDESAAAANGHAMCVLRR